MREDYRQNEEDQQEQGQRLQPEQEHNQEQCWQDYNRGAGGGIYMDILPIRLNGFTNPLDNPSTTMVSSLLQQQEEEEVGRGGRRKQKTPPTRAQARAKPGNEPTRTGRI